MTYTLIHYRPDGADYRRSCLMGSTSSDIDILSFEDIDTAAKSLADKLFWNENNKDLSYSDWETTILVDGYTENDAWWKYNLAVDEIEGFDGPSPDEIFGAVREAAKVKLAELQRELTQRLQREKEEKAAQAAIAKVRQAEADERRERAELARLSEKYARV